MPKNKVSSLITDQEMAFARLILAGTMTDRDAAVAAGLPPATAAYTKSLPRVRTYMAEHRAAVEQQLIQQEAEALHQRDLNRERVLARLWDIANLSPEMTRNSVTGQIKALAMIVAIEGLIPNRRAASAEKTSAPPPAPPAFYRAAWLREQEEQTNDHLIDPALAEQEDETGLAEPEPTPGLSSSPALDPGESVFAQPVHPVETTPPAPPAPVFDSAPDTRVPFSINKGFFGRRR